MEAHTPTATWEKMLRATISGTYLEPKRNGMLPGVWGVSALTRGSHKVLQLLGEVLSFRMRV